MNINSSGYSYFAPVSWREPEPIPAVVGRGRDLTLDSSPVHYRAAHKDLDS